MKRRKLSIESAILPKKSAAVLLYRDGAEQLEVLLVHPGGPFWAKKDNGAWSLPKGEFTDDEDPEAAARREFQEETGMAFLGRLVPLEPLRQRSAKVVYAWAGKGDFDPSKLQTNSFTMEWPPRSGKTQQFPEVDRADWFSLEKAREKILPGQAGFLDQLQKLIGSSRQKND